MVLSEIKPGEEAVVVKIHGHGAFRKRVMEMGFVRGRLVKAMMSAPLRDPIKYSLMGYEVSLRRSEADMIEVEPVEDDAPATRMNPGELVDDMTEETGETITSKARVINVALIGNPNCGKTSLFNKACGASEHVGNYSGVTVDAKKGSFTFDGYRFNFVDLPGTYSLSAYSPEELYVRRYLKDEKPDVILNVVDSTNLERNLYLTTELIDMDRPMVIALNMYDDFLKQGHKLDYKVLGGMIGVPVVPTTALSGRGLDQLLHTIIDVYEYRQNDVRHVHVSLGPDVEVSLNRVKDCIKSDPGRKNDFAARYLAIKLLERDGEARELIEGFKNRDKIISLRDKEVQLLEKRTGEDISSLIANEKYGFIAGALAETMERNEADRITSTQIIDTFVTNKLFGFPIFVGIMLFIFWVTFSLGQYPNEWIQALVDRASEAVHQYMSPGPLKDLLADGVIGGVGGVIVFLPNILILYFFISFMEDSGYMARAAFIMDKLMHRIGLHGKSFIPLMMGFGCNVPAIIASRTIESRSSRIITVLINPFMSCSARLPIYVLLVGVFFPTHAALVMISLYVLGVLVAIVTARLLRKVWFKNDETPFVMELPPYRFPGFRTTMRHMWGKGKEYLKKMGGIILVGSIVIWALNYFPLRDGDNKIIENKTVTVVDGNCVEEDVVISETVSDSNAIDPDNDSYLQMLGKAVNPVMEPLGFHWRATIAAIAGLPAKEIVVSTLGVLYTGDEAVSEAKLDERLVASGDFDAASALSLMVFILLYCPCIASITAIVKETGSWKYGAFSVLYNTAIAWLIALATYRLALLF